MRSSRLFQTLTSSALLLLLATIVLVEARPVVRNIKSEHEWERLLRKHSSQTGLPIVADFYSPSCGPCRMMAPIFSKLAKKLHDQAVFVKVDTNAVYQLSSKYQIRSVPTFMFFNEGKKVFEFSGAGEDQLNYYTEQIIAKAQETNVKLTVESLIEYYAKVDPSKSTDDVIALFNKCSDGCVGSAAASMARKLRKKYKQLPKLEKRFEPQAAAEDDQANKKGDSDKQQKKTASAGATDKANLHLASVEQLQAELEARMDQQRDEEAEADDEEDSEDLAHTYRPSNFPVPVAIIGSGPAGLSAAIYAARAGLNPVVIAPPLGGQLLGKGVDVENYPGMINVTGPEVINVMRKQAIQYGTKFEMDAVVSIDASTRPFTVHTNSTAIKTHSIILATGAESNWLDIPGEYEYRGGGVSSCATCDGALFAGRDVVVVGGGDTAMEDALVLARTSQSVTLIHRRDTFRASKILSQRVMEHPNINIVWDTIITEIIGENTTTEGSDEGKMTVSGAKLQNVKTMDETTIQTDAVFVAIGHTPATQFLEKVDIEYDPAHPGYVLTKPLSTKTSVEGIFAAGDVTDAIYRQAITSAGKGASAALDAERWLSEQGLGNEAAALEAELLAELMADDGPDRSSYNAYEDNSVMGGKGRKESVGSEL